MSETAERFDRLAAAFAEKVAAVPPDRWEAPSPCEGWSARDVVRHVVETQDLFLGLVGRSLGEIPDVDDDPAAAWDAARSRVRSELEDPERAGATFEGMFGTTSYEEAIDRFICGDLLVHGWDLARAAGLDDRMDPAEVRRVTEQYQAFGEAARQPGVFGPALEPPPGCDEQTRLLALVGRRARD